MPEDAKPKPLSAEEGTENPEPAPGPKGFGTLKKGVQPPNADPENPDEKPDSGTGTKIPGMLGGKVEPGQRG